MRNLNANKKWLLSTLYVGCLVALNTVHAADEVVDNGATRTVTPGDTVNNYLVANASTLNGTAGSAVGTINSQSSTVNLAGTVGQRIDARLSSISLSASHFTAASTFATVVLNASNGVISNGSSLINTGGSGLLLTRNVGETQGSTATVSDSSITGTTSGATVNALSTLTLTDSQVTGTTGQGVLLRAGNVTATGSTIVGAQNGIQMVVESAQLNTATIDLTGTQVTGQSGAAIQVGRGAVATINVRDGSVLTGSNGNLVEVINASTATVNAQNVNLVGNVATTGASTVNLALNEASLTGNVVNDGGSTATVTLGSQGVLKGNVINQGSSTASVSVGSQGAMMGDVINEAGSTANVSLASQGLLTGQLVNVTSASLAADSRWVMTADSQVQDLSMSGGTVVLSQASDFHTLSLASLNGSGTFVMAVDFAPGLGDLLDVSGQATGDYGLLIRSTGTDPVNDQSLRVVHTGEGDARFSLVGGAVDLGTWSYGLEKRDNDWYLDAATKTVSPGARSVIALFNTAPTVWYGELTSLRSRMGELRLNDGQSGGWLRTYGNKYNVSDASGVGYQQTQQGISFGADVPLPYGDGQWLVGVLGGYSKSNLDLDRGTSGTVDSFYMGPYITWLDKATGYYFDGVIKVNRFRNNADVSMSDGTRTKGDYDNVGLGASAEFGRHINLANGYFLEPFGQLSSVVIQGRDYQLDNDMQASGDRARSLLGKLGTTAGRNFDLGQGRTVQPYVTVALAHEFAKNNEVQVNNNTFNNDLSGSRGEVGAGVAVSMNERLQLHADVQYSNGENIEQPWGANIGLRYSW